MTSPKCHTGWRERRDHLHVLSADVDLRPQRLALPQIRSASLVSFPPYQVCSRIYLVIPRDLRVPLCIATKVKQAIVKNHRTASRVVAQKYLVRKTAGYLDIQSIILPRPSCLVQIVFPVLKLPALRTDQELRHQRHRGQRRQLVVGNEASGSRATVVEDRGQSRLQKERKSRHRSWGQTDSTFSGLGERPFSARVHALYRYSHD